MTKFTHIESIQVFLIGTGLVLILGPTVQLLSSRLRSRTLLRKVVRPADEVLSRQNSESLISYRPIPVQAAYKPSVRIEDAQKDVRAGEVKKTTKMQFGRMPGSSPTPLNAVSREKHPESHLPSEIPSSAEMWMKRIFILDDDASSGMTLALIVADLGFEPVICQSPTEALARLLTEPFNLLITDYQMLLLNGLQLAQKLRNADCPIPIVLISGDIAEIDLFLAEQLDVRAILAKPVSVPKLKYVMERSLNPESTEFLRENPVPTSHKQQPK